MSCYYELVNFTSGSPKHTNMILDALDPNNYITKRLNKYHCTLRNGALTKDMTSIGRKPQNIIILDISSHHYNHQPSQSFPIFPWKGDSDDKQLSIITPILIKLSTLPDCRDALR